VVEAPKLALVEDLSQRQNTAQRAFRFTQAQLDAYGIAELHKLEEVLRGDNAAAMQTVAEAIARKISWKPRIPEPRPFLIAYYDDLKAHLERKLLLGDRRKDKHSR